MGAALSTWVEGSLNMYRDLRDQWVVNCTRLAFRTAGIWRLAAAQPPHERLAAARARLNGEVRRDVLAHIGEGGFAQAVCRIVLAGMISTGPSSGAGLRLANCSHAACDQHAAPQARWTGGPDARGARISAGGAGRGLERAGAHAARHASRDAHSAWRRPVMMIEPTLATRIPNHRIADRHARRRCRSVMQLACGFARPSSIQRRRTSVAALTDSRSTRSTTPRQSVRSESPTGSDPQFRG